MKLKIPISFPVPYKDTGPVGYRLREVERTTVES